MLMRRFHQVLASPELGGGELMALHLAQFLRERTQDSEVWIPGDGPAQRKAKALGLPTSLYPVNRLTSPSRVKTLAGNVCAWRQLQPHRSDLIHVHSPLHYRALWPALKLSRATCVVHVHLEPGERALQWAFQKPPDLIITCARFLEPLVRGQLPERYQRRQRIVAVSNAIDTQRFFPGDRAAAKRRVGAPWNRPLALMLANVAPHKGQETAIQATAALQSVGLDLTLWLAGLERGGESHYTRRLRALCRDLGVADRVDFLGHRDDTADLLRAADVLLLPSTHEGLPLCVLEAQATKVPVLAAPSGGIPEVIVDGVTGFLIPASDAATYAQRISCLLRHPALYHRMTEQAYTRILIEHSWQGYTDQIWSLYHELLTTPLIDFPRQNKIHLWPGAMRWAPSPTAPRLSLVTKSITLLKIAKLFSSAVMIASS
jgi:glycosyltransferase involved in cell wall biosynthesis